MATDSTKTDKGRKPFVYCGAFSGEILLAMNSKGVKGHPGVREAVGTTYDVTTSAIHAVLERVEKHGLIETKADGSRYKITIQREPIA